MPGATGTVSNAVAWLAVPLTLVYGAAVWFSEGPSADPALSVAASALLFIISIGLYLQLAAIVFETERWRRLVTIETVLALLLLLGSAVVRPIALRPLLALFVPASLVGLAARAERRDSTTFWIGLAGLVFIMIGFNIGKWPEQVRVIREAAPWIAGDVVGKVQAYGISVDHAETMIAAWTDRIRMAGWLLPGMMTMSALIPYGVGSLWFLSRRATLEGRPTPIRRFTDWSISRWWLLPTVIAAGLHFTSSETVRLIGDNVLFGLAIVFAIVGTSALESFLRARNVPVWGRVIAYAIIAFAHLYGLLLLIAAGLIDTIIGVRRRISPVTGGKE